MAGGLARWLAWAGVLLALLGTGQRASAASGCVEALRAMSPGSAVAPRIRIWTPDTRPADWAPPPCGVSLPGPFTLLLEGVAAYEIKGGTDTELARFARVSTLTGIQYWSVTRQRWRPLVTRAQALERPDLHATRGDFAREEIRPGKPIFHYQEENTPAAALIYRTRVLERSADRLVVEVENAQPVSRFLMPLFAPGDYQFVHVFQRDVGNRWLHYMALRLHAGFSLLLAGHEDSFVNRMGALFRYFSNTPTTAWPPAALGS